MFGDEHFQMCLETQQIYRELVLKMENKQSLSVGLCGDLGERTKFFFFYILLDVVVFGGNEMRVEG